MNFNYLAPTTKRKKAIERMIKRLTNVERSGNARKRKLFKVLVRVVLLVDFSFLIITVFPQAIHFFYIAKAYLFVD